MMLSYNLKKEYVRFVELNRQYKREDSALITITNVVQDKNRVENA